MGNLEKLGILVMVILVVVVGVVAITPQERVAQALRDPSGAGSDVHELEVVPQPRRTDTPKRVTPRVAERDQPAASPRRRWPDDPVRPGTDPASDSQGQVRSANLGDDAEQPRREVDEDPRERWRREFEGRDPQGASEPGVEGGDPVAVSTYREYTLKPQDRLFEIARTELGDGSRWQETLDLNPSLDPRRLPVGARILLPRRGEARTAADPQAARSIAKVYVVRKGDTLSGIASKELGGAAKWRSLLDANRDQISTPEELRSGMKLRIPGATKPAPRRGAELRRTAVAGKIYNVVRGDTLSAISQSQLGTSRRWREILKANQDTLESAGDLQPGMKLRIP